MSKPKREPFWEGYEAYDDDKGLEDNPYPKKPARWDNSLKRYLDPYHEWIQGWESGENEALHGTD